MRHYTLGLFLVALLAGCRPLHFITQSYVCPIQTESKVSTESLPVNTSGPVVAMPLGSCRETDLPKVALVDVDGLLLNTDLTGPYSWGENPVSIFREKLDAIAADPAVRAVVIRINSPGGGVTATDIMCQDLLRFRQCTHLPVVACLMDLGAGGAYYLATASDTIFAHPTTVTGGIGVILNLYNLREAMGYFNVTGQPVKAGPNIDMGTTASPLTPDAKKLLQAMADEFHQRFQQQVTRSRPQVNAADATNFDGRVFPATQALERGLIDRLGYLDDAVAAARELGGLTRSQLILYRRPNDPAFSPYSLSPNVPLQTTPWLPISIPGLDRTRLPSFLYMWQPEATMERLSGK